jgi:hydroxyacylglutathione hydrolase
MKIWITKSGYRVIRIVSGRSNVFLLKNEEKNILIDTSPEYVWRLLLRRLKRLNIYRIDCLILTHTHIDHAANAYRIREKFNALVVVHQNEASYLTSGSNIIPDGTNRFSNILSKMAKNIAHKIKYKPCPYDLLVDKRFDLTDFGFNAYIVYTPGHSTGSMSVIIDNEIAITGDCMFGVFKGSVFPPFASDVSQMIGSWGKLLETGCRVFLPSHGSANSRSLVEKDYHKRINKIRQQAMI